MAAKFVGSQEPLKDMRDVQQKNGGLVPYVERDHQGRLIKASGRIHGNMELAKGTRVNGPARQLIKGKGDGSDDAGHIIPCSCGGSGQSTDNLYPQNAHINRGAQAQMDRSIAESLMSDSNHSVVFEVGFIYEDTQHPDRPSYVYQHMDTYINDKLQSSIRDGDPNFRNSETR
ncbi:unnamed protein product [Adineta steineri]|uniref:Type VII secretion system protein EssD-like domain-containing protein n=1 Tax=Adineta steineri TaxID=433720 RepID=A0A813YXE1_9BILA|nr:unnamed protein product [Adineta steineri]CAF1312753.1 unnamed protein product [Adineta steineri]CAF3507116.1 unnamed protein product [Adineta steineri]CAF3725681.1 unnamed protein product [Adineta steineri]